MARSAFECALMLESMVNPISNRSFTNRINDSVEGMTLAVIPSLLKNCDPDVINSFEDSLRTLSNIGINITESEPMGKYQPISIVRVEGATYMEDILRESSHLIGEEVRKALLEGLDHSVHDYVRSLEWRRRLEFAFEETLRINHIDGYIAPTCSYIPELIGDESENSGRKSRNTSVFNQSRQPSISIPNGFDSSGTPTGLMISTKQDTDDLTLQIAHNFQKVTDFHSRRPKPLT